MPELQQALCGRDLVQASSCPRSIHVDDYCLLVSALFRLALERHPLRCPVTDIGNTVDRPGLDPQSLFCLQFSKRDLTGAALLGVYCSMAPLRTYKASIQMYVLSQLAPTSHLKGPSPFPDLLDLLLSCTQPGILLPLPPHKDPTLGYHPPETLPFHLCTHRYHVHR